RIFAVVRCFCRPDTLTDRGPRPTGPRRARPEDRLRRRKVRWAGDGPESPTSPRPSPPPRAERERPFPLPLQIAMICACPSAFGGDDDRRALVDSSWAREYHTIP